MLKFFQPFANLENYQRNTFKKSNNTEQGNLCYMPITSIGLCGQQSAIDFTDLESPHNLKRYNKSPRYLQRKDWSCRRQKVNSHEKITNRLPNQIDIVGNLK